MTVYTTEKSKWQFTPLGLSTWPVDLIPSISRVSFLFVSSFPVKPRVPLWTSGLGRPPLLGPEHCLQVQAWGPWHWAWWISHCERRCVNCQLRGGHLFRVLLHHEPMGVPQLDYWVLGKHSFAELEFINGLFRLALFHFLSGLSLAFLWVASFSSELFLYCCIGAGACVL